MLHPTNEQRDLAMTILEQMGGAGRVKAMLGAHFARIANGVGIKWPSRKPSRGNCVMITLQPSDTYTLKFYNIKKSGTPLCVIADVYAEDLTRIFEEQTGYRLSLN